jgi:hypothetical protein
VQPGREKPLDVAAAARPLQARSDLPSLDDDERRQLVDGEALDEIRPFFARDAVQPERAVVPAALQDLSEEALDSPALAGEGGVEEDEPRLAVRGATRRDDRVYDAPPSTYRERRAKPRQNACLFPTADIP